jgi:hypothetical protein
MTQLSKKLLSFLLLLGCFSFLGAFLDLADAPPVKPVG